MINGALADVAAEDLVRSLIASLSADATRERAAVAVLRAAIFVYFEEVGPVKAAETIGRYGDELFAVAVGDMQSRPSPRAKA